MHKEKHGNLKGLGVIELCHKSIKRVKVSEMNDSKKKCLKRSQLESICKVLSTIAYPPPPPPSIEIMSSEEEHIIVGDSTSCMPGKAFTMANEENENKNHDNQ